jgi:hypothetical protein
MYQGGFQPTIFFKSPPFAIVYVLYFAIDVRKYHALVVG